MEIPVNFEYQLKVPSFNFYQEKKVKRIAGAPVWTPV